MRNKIVFRIYLGFLFCLTFLCYYKGEAAVAQKEGGSTIYARLRKHMVETQIVRRGVQDSRVLEAMRTVPRHRFVPGPIQTMAYNDSPLPIGEGQTISQPYIVAYMTEVLKLQKSDKVLEIGTGSGYQAAILAEIVGQVYSMEIVSSLAQRADQTLKGLGYNNVEVKAGDGYQGWPDKAPFDAIIVTAAPDKIPPVLKEQLKIGGRMVIPVGRLSFHQELILITRTSEDNWREDRLFSVRFVPMTGGEGIKE